MTTNNNPPNPHHYTPDDEIDLFELLETIWKGKFIIAAVTLLCLLVAGGAIWWMKPVYSSTVYFLPPTDIGLQEMNKLSRVDAKFRAFKVDDVYQMFLENLTSSELRQAIFEKYQLESYYAPNLANQPLEQQQLDQERALARLRADLNLALPGRNATTQERSLQLAMKKSPTEVAAIAQDVYEKARIKTINDIFHAITTDRDALISQYQENIRILMISTAKQREDRLIQLNEAIIIARSLDRAEPGEFSPDANIHGVINQGLPLYSLGYRYLEAEKDALLKRENNEPFIPGLRELQVMVESLQEMVIDQDKFQVVRLSQAALPATKPDKPKPALMIALSGVAGVMLGTMLALVRQAIINRRKSKLEAAGHHS